MRHDAGQKRGRCPTGDVQLPIRGDDGRFAIGGPRQYRRAGFYELPPSINAGLTLGLGGMITVLIMPVAGLLTGVIQPKYLVLISLVGTGIALWLAAGLNFDIGFWNVSLSRTLQVVWLPLLFIPLSTVQFVGVPPEQNNNASAIINMMRNPGGSFGVSIATTILAWRGQFHHSRLVEHVTPYNGYGQVVDRDRARRSGPGLGHELPRRVHRARLGRGRDLPAVPAAPETAERRASRCASKQAPGGGWSRPPVGPAPGVAMAGPIEVRERAGPR